VPDLRPSWERLLAVHFGVSNRLELDGGQRLAEVMGPNEVAVDRTPPGPFVLPHSAVGPEHRSSYVAIAVDDDQASDLGRALTGCIGPTYTTSARGRDLDLDDPTIAAAMAFAGSPALVTRVTVVDGEKPAHRLPGDSGKGDARPRIRDEVRDQVLRLQRLLAERPIRRVEEVRPLGRLLRDFSAALERGDEEEARTLLYGGIADSGRLSGLNRHFLTVRMLAAFEHWAELEAHPALDDLLRVDRPALVSDAMAGLAQHLLSEQTGDAQAAFEATIAPRFGALVLSVEAIRSAAGAEYYVRWQVAAGDAPGAIARRLDALAWGELDVIVALLDRATPPPTTPLVDAEAVVEAASTGRFDLVVEMLGQVEPSADLVPIVVQAMTATMGSAAAEQLVRFRESLGEDVFDAARLGPVMAVPSNEAMRSWAERLQAVAAGEVAVATAVEEVDEAAITDLLRGPGHLDDVLAVVGSTTDPALVGRLLDLVLVLLDRLHRAAGREARTSVAALRAAAIDMWLVGDDSGDRGRAAEVVDQIEVLLDDGVSVDGFADLAANVADAWTPFLNDVSFGLTVRLLEVLAAARPAEDGFVPALAAAALGRLGPTKVGRLDPVDVHLAQAIADDLTLGLDLVAHLPTDVAKADAGPADWHGSVGIYCLDTAVTRNAIRVLARILPNVEVDEVHDHVASEPLRALARRVDLLVVAWRVAKHAATDALRAERGTRPLCFAAGTGSSSIVRAVIEFVTSELLPSDS
jgi:hypothetical protein